VIDLYYHFGEYDGMLIVEAPDDTAVNAAVIAVIAPRRHLKATRTTRLFTVEETVCGRPGPSRIRPRRRSDERHREAGGMSGAPSPDAGCTRYLAQPAGGPLVQTQRGWNGFAWRTGLARADRAPPRTVGL
jgi:hypothetical protein